MVPMRTSWIFRSRWIALLWAAGIIWLALSVAGPDEHAHDAVSNGDVNALAAVL